MRFLERVIPKVGDRLGRYEIVEEVGRGGFGVVYHARQIGLDADVAIKLMLPPMSAHQEQLQLYERFVQEAQVVKRLEHPNAIKVRDFGRTDEGLPYLVMEYVAGVTLDRLLNESGPLPLERTVRIAKQVLGCLAEAHHLGIVHRDLKPANIMVRDIFGEVDSVKVVDFGIAKVMGQEAEVRTKPGLAFGTPRYMSPEQARGAREVDGRTDLYALGLVMAECLTGRPVVAKSQGMAAAAIHAGDDALAFEPAIRESPLFPVIDGATRKDIGQRFPDALAMRQALDGVERQVSLPGLPALCWPSERAGAVRPAAPASPFAPMRPRERDAAPSTPIAAAATALPPNAQPGSPRETQPTAGARSAQASRSAVRTQPPPPPRETRPAVAVPATAPAPAAAPTRVQARRQSAPVRKARNPVAAVVGTLVVAGIAVAAFLDQTPDQGAASAPVASSTRVTAPIGPLPLVKPPSPPIPPDGSWAIRRAEARQTRPNAQPAVPATPSDAPDLPRLPVQPPDAAPAPRTPSSIHSVMRAYSPAIRACYTSRLPARPDMAGTISIRFTIDGSGRVTDSDVAADELGDPEVARCVSTMIDRLTFPASTDASTTITFPFVFRPE